MQQACIFSSDNQSDKKLFDNYFIESFSGDTSLVFRDRKSSSLLLVANLDSIKMFDKNIIGHSQNTYFLIRRGDKTLFRLYHNYRDFLIGCDSFHLIASSIEAISLFIK